MTKHIDWDKVDQFFMCGSSITQCAAGLGVSVDTLERRAKSEKNAAIAEIQQSKKEKGNLAIHSAQFEKAIKDKNPTMLIWLGKQRLNQKDSVDTTPNNDKEISQALINIHSTDVEDMKTKINELQNVVDKYESKEQPNEPVTETNTVDTKIDEEVQHLGWSC